MNSQEPSLLHSPICFSLFRCMFTTINSRDKSLFDSPCFNNCFSIKITSLVTLILSSPLHLRLGMLPFLSSAPSRSKPSSSSRWPSGLSPLLKLTLAMGIAPGKESFAPLHQMFANSRCVRSYLCLIYIGSLRFIFSLQQSIDWKHPFRDWISK